MACLHANFVRSLWGSKHCIVCGEVLNPKGGDNVHMGSKKALEPKTRRCEDRGRQAHQSVRRIVTKLAIRKARKSNIVVERDAWHDVVIPNDIGHMLSDYGAFVYSKKHDALVPEMWL